MKKIIFPFYLLLILLSSCGLDKRQENYIIGVSQCSDDAWRRNMNEEILREASFNPGVEVIIKTAYDSNQNH